MFKIGVFSKIAVVPISQLRYYDEIGLFTPAHIDAFTGYRYYSAKQLPELNRVLALKELGLSLNQIRQLLEDEVTAEEMRGMLSLKKAQIEQTLLEEVQRLRAVEARLRQIESEGANRQDDVIFKAVPAQSFVSLRRILPSFCDGPAFVGELMQLPAQAGPNKLGLLTIIIHSEAFRTENVDVEMGFLIEERLKNPLVLADGGALQTRVLPARRVVSAVRIGSPQDNIGCYASLGVWIEENGYRISNPGREIFIEPPRPGYLNETVTEIQFPVEKANGATYALPG